MRALPLEIQTATGVFPGPSSPVGELASHQPAMSEATPIRVEGESPDSGEIAADRSGAYKATRLFPTPSTRSGPMKTRLIFYCTRNGLGLTVRALLSRPSPQVNQVPAAAGVGTYAPHMLALTSIAGVQLDGGVEDDIEKPNWIGEVDGETRALIPMVPLP
jgi:hypothetical protein